MPITIIAEAGVNHNGSLEMAKEMARVAKACGADIVKYQTAVPELVRVSLPKSRVPEADHRCRREPVEMIRRLHFSFDAHRELKEYCDSIGIQYLGAVRSAQRPVPRHAGAAAAQDPLGEITNLPYLEAMAALKTPVLLPPA